ncbi:MAG: nucleoside recognition domain-containing protein [Bacteroidota bacterium]
MKKLTKEAKELFRDTFRTVFILLRIMIPVSILVKILTDAGAIGVIGDALYPVMKYVGLPGEMGLAWATGIITNLYGGIYAFVALWQDLPLSIAQVTIISTMMLVAHTFPIELSIARKSGLKIIPLFLLRFLMAYFFGWILNIFYQSSGLMQDVCVPTWKPSPVSDPSLWAWGLNELKNYAVVFLFIFALMLLLRILKYLKIIDVINRALNPMLRFLGIGKEVTTITMIGITLGVVYGGALIIDEARKNPDIKRKDIFYSLALMGLSHSLIEDTLLLMSLGADFFGIFVWRFALSLGVIWLLVRITRRMKESNFNRLFLRKKFLTNPELNSKQT